ncbi:MAG: InlB B-repeat-containing protein [Lachnospiraceae bacterium]|nr:InlB B-repeat-containing protein [Lachnospiraceae bacterium]
MNKKIIAGLLTFMLVVAGAGSAVFAAEADGPSDADSPAIEQADTDVPSVEDAEEVSEDGAPAGEDAEEVSEDGAPAGEVPDEEQDIPAADGVPGKYTVKFDANGGTGDLMEDIERTVDQDFELPECTYTKNGFTFKEWNTQSDGNGTGYDAGDLFGPYAAGEIKTLYAIWDKETYNITYHLDGGTNDKNNPETYDVETDTIIFRDPVKKGYKFDGWFEDAAFKTSIDRIVKGSTGNVDVYAKWLPCRYTVRFNGNGSTGGAMQDMTGCEFDKAYYLSANSFTKKGYNFTGWNTRADGKGTAYADKARIRNLSETDGAVITVYAQWNIVQYTVRYTLNGGKNDAANPAAYTVATNTIALKPATRKGYTLAGWYKDSSFSSKITQIQKGSTGNLVLYAKWNPITYKVKFDGHGATSGKMSTLTGLKYDVKYKLSKNKFKKKGYSFDRWTTKRSGKGKAFANREKVKNLTATDKKTVTLYAQWKIKEYTIKYVLNGGKNNSKNPSTYTVKTKKITLQPATRKGYTFKGWYKDKAFKHRVRSIPKGSTGNKTLYAKWEANKYRIRFNGNKADHGSMSDMKNCKYGKKYKLKANAFRKDGYKFTGWNTKRNGTGKSFSNKQKVKNLKSKNGAVVTLYAQWKPIEYTIVFDGNGSTSGSMEDMTCTYGKKYYLNENEYERRRFLFDCWNTKRDGSGKVYTDGAAVSDLTMKDGDRVVLYAQWDEDYEEIRMNISKPSQDDISSYINSHPYYSTDTYYQPPSLQEPYSAGRMSDQSLDGCLNQLKTYRYIAGVHTNIYLSDTYNDRAIKGTLISQLNNSISRSPSRPAVLNDPKYNQLFDDGSDGCENSIMAKGYPTLWMRDAIDKWMEDSDDDNIDTLGNRRYILSPSLSQVGFGRTGGSNGAYCAAYVIGGDNRSESSTRVAWPAHNTPTGLFDEDTAWSLSLGREISKDDVKVKVIRDRDHKEWLFSSDRRDGKFYVNNGRYGVKGCIIFRPDDIEVDDDETYTVKIFMMDRKEMIRYKVNFFNL